LPEGASNVRVMPHQTIPLGVQHSVERTSLNYFGRPVVTLTADNLFTSRKLHVTTVKISYDFPVVNLLLTPMIIVAGIFAIFLAYVTYANTDVLLVPIKDDPTASRALGIAEQQNRIAATCAKMEASYARLDVLFDNIMETINDDHKAADMEHQRKEVESALKESESDLAVAAVELKQLGSGKAELVSTLLRRFTSKRDSWMRAMTLRRVSENSRNDRDNYHKTMLDTIAPALTEIAVDIDELVTALTDDL
jgi:Ribophorin I